MINKPIVRLIETGVCIKGVQYILHRNNPKSRKLYMKF